MSDDGADLGFGAEAGMKAVMGGEQPKKGMSPAEMRAYLEKAHDPSSYDGCANVCARIVLGVLERHPEAQSLPADRDVEWPKKADGSMDWDAPPIVLREGVYEFIQRVEPETYATHKAAVFSELTGFMWGWAVNAARYALELPPVPNPAIVTIG